MFGKLKEKLKSWFTSSSEKAPAPKEKKPKAKAKPEKKLVKPVKTKKPEKKLEKSKKLEEKKKPQLTKQKIEEPELKQIEEELEEAIEEEAEEEVEEEIEEELEKEQETRIEKERKIGGLIAQDIEEEKVKKDQAIEQELAQVKQEIKEEKEKKGFFGKLFSKFKFHIDQSYFNEIFEELELILLENNVAIEVVDKIKEQLQKSLVGKEVAKEKVEDEIRSALKAAIETVLVPPFDILPRIKEKNKSGEPFVMIFFGINGTGKTTTIAKIASFLKSKNLSVVLAAADTFRAASIEQLQEHANKIGVDIVKNQYNSDPASVAFDAIKHAKAQKAQVVLIDTAGRMHTKESLMKEMEKIVRVTKPDLKIFLGESITGNDAIEQARTFQETVGIDGIILSKADVDDKGGTALSVSYITGKPILFLGVGQEYKDLKPFKKEDFIESLGL